MSIFIIGDLHLDHTNIIKFCDRPFKSALQMNEVCINRWNETVGLNDKVYYLGDVSFGRGSRPAKHWLPQLNGHKILIKGNHDHRRDLRDLEWHDHLIRTYLHTKFYLVHDPLDAPWWWDSWVIHGHKHNNNLGRYPLINRREMTINVGAELLDYRPILLETLMAQVFHQEVTHDG